MSIASRLQHVSKQTGACVIQRWERIRSLLRLAGTVEFVRSPLKLHTPLSCMAAQISHFLSGYADKLNSMSPIASRCNMSLHRPARTCMRQFGRETRPYYRTWAVLCSLHLSPTRARGGQAEMTGGKERGEGIVTENVGST